MNHCPLPTKEGTMKRFGFLLAAIIALAPFAAAAPPTATYHTGLKPTPAHVLECAPRFEKSNKIGAPAQYACIPARLSMWGNNQYGCCVTTEECFAKIADAPNAFITEQTCIQWAAQHGVLNGATLDEVLDAMARDGITAEDGKVYKDGPKLLIADYSNKATLAAAIYQGRVKIAVAASQIMQSVNGSGGKSGWHGINWQSDDNTDHCVSLCGYGPASYLYSALGVPLPAGVDPAQYGYLMFTWSSIGFVSHDSLVAVTREAWLRQPTTAGYPQPPEPTPTPTPAPQPTPTPAPNHTVTLWIFAAEVGVMVMLLMGIFFLGRRSAPAK